MKTQQMFLKALMEAQKANIKTNKELKAFVFLKLITYTILTK